MPAAIILAAGSSTRLGQPKQNIRIANETLLERAIRVAHLAGLSPIFAVVSPELTTTPGSNFTILTNHHASEGMASSIRLGIRAAIEAAATGVVILACDQIAVTPEHLRAIIQVETELRASSYAGRKGIPAYFPSSLFEELLNLRGDTGARGLLRDALALPLANGNLDIDTPEDLDRTRQLYPSSLDR